MLMIATRGPRGQEFRLPSHRGWDRIFFILTARQAFKQATDKIHPQGKTCKVSKGHGCRLFRLSC